jgi:hopanoid biosynthesis associated radical SAM protein HpnH
LSVPAVQKVRIGKYVLRQRLAGRTRFPLVLMLEPLFRCNLRCVGCGKIAQSREVLEKEMSLQDCIRAVEECGAPVVSIPGGEPLLHRDIPEIVGEILRRKRFVYLCTNGLLVPRRIEEFEPTPYLAFNVHLDGMAERHDAMVNCTGAFDRTVESIRLLLSRGFRVTTNTTLFAGEDPEKLAEFFDFLTALGVEGMTVSPGFSFEDAEAGEGFLGRGETQALFRRVFELGRGRGWRFNHSILYLRFLAGLEEYACSPWGNPTRNVFGWQMPCYLLDDGYASTYKELMQSSPWERYGTGRDARCANCMVHCGFEPSAVVDSALHPLKAWTAYRRGLPASS